jgi:hypothetical protein
MLMRDRLRSFDSKITFFAFADIITAVSGMLIFITLLLATDLGRPTNSRTQSVDSDLERQINETLAQQAEADAQNRGLQNLLTAADTAPPPEKLQADITRLRAELADEKSKHANLAQELATSRTNLAERDRVLGITDVKERILVKGQELDELARKEADVRDQTSALESRMPGIEDKILKYRAREGEIWLIPDRTGTSKEPVLAIVSGKDLQMERFNQPDQTETLSKGGAFSGFKSYLKRVKPEKQYVVFLVRPSGIDLFRELVEVARNAGFEVGFDPLEEDRQIHFTPPPPIDDQAVPSGRRAGSTGTGRLPPGGGGGGGPGGSGTVYNRNGTGGDGGTDITGGGNPGGGAGSTNGTVEGGGTNLIGGGTNTIGGGTNLVGGGTNLVGGGTNLIGGTNLAGEADGSLTSTNAVSQKGATNSTATKPSPPQKQKSWWQRLLEWLGI